MLERTEGDRTAFATVEERLLRQAVERLKTRLPVDRCSCPACGYTGAAYRWGIKSAPAPEPGRVELLLCCPGCERPTTLAEVGADAGAPGV